MNSSLSFADLSDFESEYQKNPVNPIAQRSVGRVGIKEASVDSMISRRLNHQYSLQVEAGKVTNQKRSGRCWMFAATNVMRFEVMKKLDLEDMELSQAYPLFFDKLEKSNYFFESILKTLDEPLNGRLVSYLLTDPLGDGGQWDMFVSLVEKYGVVPKEAMPETFSSSNTMDLDRYLTLKLRKGAARLRTLHEEGKDLSTLEKLKKEFLSEIYQMLVISLGEPPKTFTYEVRNRKKEFIRVKDITPQEFYKKYVGWNLNDYVSVIHAPTKDKPLNKSFTVDYLGNVVGGKEVRYLNLDNKRLKELTIAQLQDAKAVWFGSDVRQFSRNDGYLSRQGFDLSSLFSQDFSMTKAERLDYQESKMTHAMTFVGVNLDEKNQPIAWKVENSWGEEAGLKGMYTMDDDWFDEFVYQIVVHKKYLTQAELDAYNEEPIHLDPWDPCGSLA